MTPALSLLLLGVITVLFVLYSSFSFARTWFAWEYTWRISLSWQFVELMVLAFWLMPRTYNSVSTEIGNLWQIQSRWDLKV